MVIVFLLMILFYKKYLPKIEEYKGRVHTKAFNFCIKDYNYEKHLGEGYFGNVILASKGKQKVAIKIVNLDRYDNEGMYNYKNIENEIKLTKKMSKLGVGPNLYDAFYCNQNGRYSLYLVLEYMTEGSLDKWLLQSGNKLTPQLKKELKQKLDILHKNNIYHLDIAERNILLTKKGERLEIFLGDFGISLSSKEILKQQENRNNTDLLRVLSIEKVENINTLVIKSMIYLHTFKF